MNKEADSKKRKKRKLKRRYWLLIDLAVVITLIALLIYKPARYEPIDISLLGLEYGQVHPYWTHLSSEIYNGAQLEEPFDMVVSEKQKNEAIAGWSEASEDIMLSSPTVLFVPDRIVLMGLAILKGVELVVTIEVVPEIDENRLLHLRVAKMKTFIH